MSGSGALGRQFEPPAGMDMRSPEYSAWHQQAFQPVREAGAMRQVGVARQDVENARKARLEGRPDAARRSLSKAAGERKIASSMLRGART